MQSFNVRQMSRAKNTGQTPVFRPWTAVGISFFLLLGCSTPQHTSRAHPASYVSDQFDIHPSPPQHEVEKRGPFFFKQCDPTGDRSYYSNTSYQCDGL
ncbi:MAG: hypothetical protein COT74_01220 [Bdellovibrionales bacterium CG10_big_fil_rev_8_21_14_0_10_45_34]|nr:MAG: hypothetical protein COT74_01220 [Bdellovibrionales bacterium CG10_big_fil_rev_8_21_14_0_10_45_34]